MMEFLKPVRGVIMSSLSFGIAIRREDQASALPFPDRVTRRRKRAAAALAAALSLLGPASAEAVTVRIGKDAGPLGGYVEDPALVRFQNGFSWQGSISYCCSSGVMAYLHDDSGISTSVFTSVDGYRFDALDFDLSTYSNVYRAGEGPRPPDDDDDASAKWATDSKPAYVNVGWYGTRDGVEVARYEFFGSGDFPPVFNASFSDLDSLVLRQLLPNTHLLTYDPRDPDISPGGVWCFEWCGGVEFYGLTLDVRDGTIAPVPLPATGLMLLSGLAALGLHRRRGGRSGVSPRTFMSGGGEAVGALHR